MRNLLTYTRIIDEVKMNIIRNIVKLYKLLKITSVEETADGTAITLRRTPNSDKYIQVVL